jgi:hypothetical protein
MRKRSAERGLREAKRALRRLEADYSAVYESRARMENTLRATQAELTKWEARFDELLKRVPEVPK